MSAEDDGSSSPPAPEGLQFDKVELAAPAATVSCGRCQRLIADVDEYFEIAGGMVCRTCAQAIGSGTGGAGLLRALLLGGAAALLGTIVWFAIIKLTDREFGLLAIGIGLLVGFAVRKGSRALGGWKYQVLAMALTYGSITASYVPLVLKGMAVAADKADAAKDKEKADADPQAQSALDDRTAADTTKRPTRPPASAGDVALAFLVVFGIAFASPFLQGASNIMGILIIGIALYEAWKMNRRVPIAGPFRLGGAQPGSATGPPNSPPAMTSK